MFLFFVFKQKTAYEMRISDWSSDVCSSDLGTDDGWDRAVVRQGRHVGRPVRLPERQAPQPEVERQGHQELPIRWPRITQGRSSIHLLRYLSSDLRSEERRVGEECVSTCRSRW